MQRLTGRSGREHGAVSVVVALLMVPLLGFAAIAIDVASMLSQQQRLQVAADAAALAIAQDCARNACGTPTQTATLLTNANYGSGANATLISPSPTPSAGTVTVQSSTVSHHFFAPLLGVDSTDVVAQATANWGSPVKGTAMLPLIFSWCAFDAQTHGGLPTQTTEQTIQFTKDDNTHCTGPSGNVVPAGFGWVTVGLSGCTYVSSISTVLTSDPGNSIPNGCSESDFTKLQNQVVLLPLFDAGDAGGTGSNAWYRVYGFAAFKLTGYKFPSISWNSNGCSKNCVKGYFTQFVSIDDAFTYGTGAPQGLGLEAAFLTS